MRTLFFACLLPLAACGNSDEAPAGSVPGTGSGGARSFAVAGFTGVALRGPDDVDVRIGDAFSVRAEGDAKALEQLEITRVGDTLRVGRVKRSGLNWSSGDGAKVFVTMPRVGAAALEGSGNLTIERAEGPRFNASLAGSGNLSVAAMTTPVAELSIAGSGNLTAAGNAESLKVSIAGSGDVEAGGLTARRANVSIAGSGNVTAAVDGEAKVSILGSGDVDLGPKARCQTSKMGSGDVRCGG